MPRRLVIFDLDETLVHARKEKLAHPHDFEVPPYFVYARPHLGNLIAFAAQHFDLAVWSSSSPEYVRVVSEQLFGQRAELRFAWSVEKCVQREDAKTNGYVYIKDLRKVQSHGYPVELVTIIDDSPEKIRRQPRNHIHIEPFFGEPHDQHLLLLRAKLEALAESGPRQSENAL